MIIVAGHVCLDIIPCFPSRATLDPGTLVRVGGATLSTGGVSNVGVALHRLGVPVKLIHKVGDDLFGDAVRSLLNKLSPELASGVRTVAGEVTSYSVVVAPPGVDRMFIHCPGANDTFTADDVPESALAGGSHLHFGYPPIMREVFRDPGHAQAIFNRARNAGLTTSLDLCSVDPASEAGQVDWFDWFRTVLPSVDVFTPSFDELSVMLNRPVDLTVDAVRSLAERCLEWSCGGVLMKLGDQGLYYTDGRDQYHVPCRKVDVITTNGSGDCTIAGFLASRLRGESVERALEVATAVGGFCCEAPDATSGVRPLADVEKRMLQRWWPQLETRLRFS
jgi:sugar/nucleoside kinase (ribokinase family)